ncbi:MULTISPECIES: SMI1/KNR4 family protein [unclassified Streptomyces]|uniref:SMI1/KNR4 family protein n=1 Tax=unclassified Streptomyces TaxID=2593676 RepID=UPI002E3463B5|nr:SMI1/KNR4 family protein [Streptomyces sp. NBC_01428]
MTESPLTEVEIVEAERELGVSFPEEYRAYLREVSAGGALSRLERAGRGWWWAGNDERRRGLLSIPFPHPDSYAEADEELMVREPQAEAFEDHAAYRTAWRAWVDEADGFEDLKTAGAVVIQEHGCGFSTLLALTGPLAGTVWWDGRATCDRIVPLSLDHVTGARPIEFREWLEHGSWALLPPDWGPPFPPDPVVHR